MTYQEHYARNEWVGKILKVLSVTNDTVIFNKPNGDGYHAKYMVEGGVTLLQENDLLLVKNINPNNGSISCERITTAGAQDGFVVGLLDTVRFIHS